MISSFRNLIDRGLVGSSQISKTLSFNLETQQSTFRSNMIHQINTNQKQHEMKVNGEFCDGRSLARLLGNGEGGLAEEGVMRWNWSLNPDLSSRAQGTSTGDSGRGRQGDGVDGRVPEAGDPKGGPGPGASNSRDPHDWSSGGRGYGRGSAPGLLEAWSAGVGSGLGPAAAGAQRPHPHLPSAWLPQACGGGHTPRRRSHCPQQPLYPGMSPRGGVRNQYWHLPPQRTHTPDPGMPLSPINMTSVSAKKKKRNEGHSFGTWKEHTQTSPTNPCAAKANTCLETFLIRISNF